MNGKKKEGGVEKGGEIAAVVSSITQENAGREKIKEKEREVAGSVALRIDEKAEEGSLVFGAGKGRGLRKIMLMRDEKREFGEGKNLIEENADAMVVDGDVLDDSNKKCKVDNLSQNVAGPTPWALGDQ